MIDVHVIQGVKLYSATPVIMNKWAVKASITEDGTICMILFNTENYFSIIRYFNDEELAHNFLTETVNLD